MIMLWIVGGLAALCVWLEPYDYVTFDRGS